VQSSPELIQFVHAVGVRGRYPRFRMFEIIYEEAVILGVHEC